MSADGGYLERVERLDRLRLIRCNQVGPATFRALLQQFGSARAALDALPELARRGGKELAPPSRDEAEREWQDLEALGGRFLLLGEPDYPPLLSHLEDAPPLLAALGKVELGQRPRAVALIGARNASANGRR
ncbi:MAG: DNA-processing protein DprA, partial [Kiloniellales bacterium]